MGNPFKYSLKTLNILAVLFLLAGGVLTVVGIKEYFSPSNSSEHFGLALMICGLWVSFIYLAFLVLSKWISK